jgi:hypothetical protein
MKHFEMSIAPARNKVELEGLRCRIHGQERTRPWSDMNTRLQHGRHPTRLNCLTQRRGDVNDHKAISDVRIFLRTHVMPLNEDPFREFEDGWGIKFTVNDQIGRRHVKAIEEEEFADELNNDSPFTYNNIDPFEMDGFSVRQI